MKRVVLFIATNVAILLVLGILLHLFGVTSILDERGVGLDLTALLAFSAILGMGGSFASLAFSKWTAKRLTGARVLEAPSKPFELWLVETVRKQAQAAGIGMPEVAIFPSPEPNAFATGARRDRALVAVSDGLLRSLDREEVEAVLAHEVSHIANGDMVTLALIQGVVNTFVIALARVVGFAVDRLVFRTEQGHGPAYWVTAILAQVVLGVLASPIVFWFSRRREFRADAGGARLAGRQPMIAALERLGRAASPEPLPDAMAAMGIAAPRGFARLFSTHPPIEERIEALHRLA
ncbi:MAG: protease HtpX [Proteobacteria bacterium]|nr:protease HtpX [Pseudomonadota bacterium]